MTQVVSTCGLAGRARWRLTDRVHRQGVVLLLAGGLVACAGPGEEPVPPRAPAVEAPAAGTVTRPAAVVERVSPVLAVESIDAVIPFWEALGFTIVDESRTDGQVDYIAFGKDGLSIHYHTLRLVERNIAGGGRELADSTSFVYIAVDDLDAVIERLGGAEVVVPRRRTEWGADEIYVREPGGHIVAFASFGRN